MQRAQIVGRGGVAIVLKRDAPEIVGRLDGKAGVLRGEAGSVFRQEVDLKALGQSVGSHHVEIPRIRRFPYGYVGLVATAP